MTPRGAGGRAAHEPDVVPLDIGLPKLDGWTARRLREWARPRPLLVAMTVGQAEDRARTAAAGFDHHLTGRLTRSCCIR